MFNDKNMHVGDTRLRAVGNRATIAALKMQNNPQAMTDADYKTISNRKWAESQARQRGGKIESSIDDLWGEKSFGAMQARANSQANAEGSMAAKYGGGAHGVAMGQQYNRSMANLAYKGAQTANAQANAALRKAKFENKHLARDKQNEYKDRTLRNAGIRTEIATKNQAMNIRSQKHNWNIQDRQNRQANEAQAQAAAIMQERANRTRFNNSVPALQKEYWYHPADSFTSEENFEYYKKNLKEPSKIGTVEHDQDGNRIFYNSNNSAQVNYANDPEQGKVVVVEGRQYRKNHNGRFVPLIEDTASEGTAFGVPVKKEQRANDSSVFNPRGKQ